MTQPTLKAPEHGLSLQFVTAESAWVNWSDLYQDGDEYDVALPHPTYGDVQQYAPDLFEEWETAAAEQDDCDALSEHLNDELSDPHAAEWQQRDGYDEWTDSYQPAMNYAWPVSLAYGGPSLEEAAALIDRHAGACTLVSFGEGNNPFGPEFASDTPEYGIALTGGGMDLSDHLAVAYLCCGCVPPERILSGLDNFSGPNESGRLTGNAELICQAFNSARDYLMNRADRLGDTAERLGFKFKAGSGELELSWEAV